MIYICIPSYDEEPTIGVLLWKVRQVMAEFQRDYRVLVLDDASTDRTLQVLEPYLRVMPLTVLKHERRQGHAASLERLIREAVARAPYPKRDSVVTLQADFTDDPEHIPDLVKRIEGGIDVVASVARLAEDEAPRQVRWTRRALSRLVRLFRRWPEEVSDPLSGFRAYRVICLRKVLDRAGPGPVLHGTPWTVSAQLLQLAVPEARRIGEVDVAPRYSARRRPSRLSPWPAVLDFLRYLRNAPVALLGSHVEVEELEATPIAEEWAAGRARRRRPASGAARGNGGRGRRRSSRRGGRRRRGGEGKGSADGGKASADGAAAGGTSEEASGDGAGTSQGRSRRRRRRGGRRRRGAGGKAPKHDAASQAGGDSNAQD